MRQKTSALLSLGLCIALAVVALALAVGRGGGRTRAPEADPSMEGKIVIVSPEETPAEKESGSKGGGLFKRATPTPEPTATPSPTPEPTPTPRPGPEVPARTQPAPAGYFEDAAFVGNSVVTGLDMYDYDDVLAGADFYAANSVTVLGVADYVTQMAGTTYGKVYVGLGTNEMSYDKEILRGCFEDMIDTLLGYNPDCIIYLMSVTPVSEYKSNNNSMFTKELVLEFNDMLRQIAEERGVWYLDQYSVLCNEDGYLPSDVTVDGVHFTPGHYSYWFDYLTTHYVTAAGDEATPAADNPEPVDIPVQE